MSPEQRAKAAVEHFAASLPPAIRPDLERVVTSAIRVLCVRNLPDWNASQSLQKSPRVAGARQAEGYDAPAIHFHRQWAETFRMLRRCLTG